MFRVKWLSIQAKKFKIDFQKIAILDFGSEQFWKFFIYKSPWYFLPGFESIGFLVKKMFNPDFQDGGHGSHFGFCIGTIFIIFYLQVALIFPTKFRVNWPLGLGEVVQNRFLRWQRWWPSWISDQNNFSNFD